MVKKIGKYELGKTLGSGTFGKVKYAVDTTDEKRTPYAIKVLDRKQIEKENMQEQLKNEIAIMKMLKHENVVKMFEVIQSPQHIYMVLEIVTGGELFDRIVAAKRFDEATARRYFQQLIFGVHFCHQQGVAHRDLKPENLLLDANDQLKISDFGLSAIIRKEGGNERDKLLTTTCGTPNYVAPEVLKEKGYDGMITDIWSCGVILFVMLAGYLPFDDPSMNGLFNKIERGEYRMPKQFSPSARDLIKRLLEVDPAKRITLHDVMDDKWFKEGLSAEILDRNKNIAKISDVKVEQVKTAMQETVEPTVIDGKKPNGERQGDLTAFELASRLVMGSLTPLLSKDNVTIRRNTQFVADGNINDVMSRMLSELEKMQCNPSMGKVGTEIRGYINSARGMVTYVVSFHPTVCKELVLIEVRRLRGDTLEFQDFYRKLVKSIHDICPKQPPEKEDIVEIS